MSPVRERGMFGTRQAFAFASGSCGPSKFRSINKHVTAFVLQPSLDQPHFTPRRSTFTLDHARIGHPRQHPPPFPLAKAHLCAFPRLYNTRSHTTSSNLSPTHRIPQTCLVEAVEAVVVDAAGSARPHASTLAQFRSTSTRSLRKSSQSRRRIRTTSFR